MAVTWGVLGTGPSGVSGPVMAQRGGEVSPVVAVSATPAQESTTTVAVETPQHAGLGGTLDYLSEQPLSAGTLVRVPLGRRDLLGTYVVDLVAMKAWTFCAAGP